MSKYTLEDFNELAYEFAIRNPRVVELITSPLTDKTAEELLAYGIDIKVKDHNGDEVNSIDELYLNYKHLDIGKLPYQSKTVDIQGMQVHNQDDKSYRKLVRPNSKSKFVIVATTIEKEIERIKNLIETRGRVSKLDRLISGEVFEHYDAVTFFSKTVYSLDPSSNQRKTIKSDIEFVEEWLEPKKYLQLLPHKVSLV